MFGADLPVDGIISYHKGSKDGYNWNIILKWNINDNIIASADNAHKLIKWK